MIPPHRYFCIVQYILCTYIETSPQAPSPCSAPHSPAVTTLNYPSCSNILVQFLAPMVLFILLADRTSIPNLSIVDLGYELHQAPSFNVSTSNCSSISPISRSPKYVRLEGDCYMFSNIRYAEPPVGEFRFRAPIPPRTRTKTVDQGEIGRVCPQAETSWGAIAAHFITKYLAEKKFDASALESALSNISSSPPPQKIPGYRAACFWILLYLGRLLNRPLLKESHWRQF